MVWFVNGVQKKKIEMALIYWNQLVKGLNLIKVFIQSEYCNNSYLVKWIALNFWENINYIQSIKIFLLLKSRALK